MKKSNNKKICQNYLILIKKLLKILINSKLRKNKNLI